LRSRQADLPRPAKLGFVPSTRCALIFLALMKSMYLTAILVSAGVEVALAAAVPSHGVRSATFLTRDSPDDVSGGDDDGSGLGPGASAVAESLRAASANMQERVDDGVNRYEDLESENAELWRRNKDLQHQAVASDEKAMRIKHSPGGAKTDKERELEGQVSDTRASIAATEVEKNTLVQSLHSLMITNQSEVIARRIDEVERSKARVDARFAKERAKLQKELGDVQQRASEAANIVQELQKQNEQMRAEGRAAQQDLEDLRSTASALRSESDALAKSAKSSPSISVPSSALSTAAGPLQDPNAGLHANITDLQRQLQDAQQSVERLEGELKAPRKALEQKAAQTAAATPLDDGSMEILQSLKEENADLQRSAQSARSDVKSLTSQVESLQFDKDHLVATFASSTRLEESLKQELKEKIAAKGRELAEKNKRLTEQAHAIEKAKGKTGKPVVRPVAVSPKAGNATSATRVAMANSTEPSVTPSSQATAQPQPEDPIDGMHKKALMDRYQRREMQDLSNSVSAMAGEGGAETGSAAEDVPLSALATTTAKPSTIEHFLGVDGADAAFPEPSESEAQHAPSTAQNAADDDVDELLRQAQRAVDGETP